MTCLGCSDNTTAQLYLNFCFLPSFSFFPFLSFSSFYSFLFHFFLALSFSYFPPFAFLLPPLLTFLLFYFNIWPPSLTSFFLISLSTPIGTFLLLSDQFLFPSICLLLLFILCSLSASLFPPLLASSFFSSRLVFFLSFLPLVIIFIFYCLLYSFICLDYFFYHISSSYYSSILSVFTYVTYFRISSCFGKYMNPHIFFLLTIPFYIFDVIICLRSFFLLMQ